MTWQAPALRRDDRLLGGLATGIAHEIGIEAIAVRIAFVLLFVAGGWGVMVYAGGWLAITVWESRTDTVRRPPTPKGRSVRNRYAGFMLIVAGALVLFVPVPIVPQKTLWPAGVIALGALLLWRRFSRGKPDSGLQSWWPVAVGLGLIAVGLAMVGQLVSQSSSAAGIAVVVSAAVVVVVSAPWWWRLASALDRERNARVRADERADVAAHLHDSVLQTLSLIQRGTDVDAMAALARKQERELRNWLDPQRVSRGGGSLRGRLDGIATEIESLYPVTIEIVVVGDCLVDDTLEAGVAAVREAVGNAARHSGANKIDVYAEVGADAVELFVRDTGCGFDPDTIDPDRHGVRNSIIGRIQRIGGEVTVVSSPVEAGTESLGTEVEIRLPSTATTRPAPQPEENV